MNGPKDPLGEAIEAVADRPADLKMKQFNLTIASTGRPAIVVLPEDATDGELAEVAGWLLTAALNAYRAERAAPASGLVVVRALPPKPAG